MTVYNGEKYLSEAVESILNQSFTDFEFIIIDDGSQDNSYQLLSDYQRMDNRIKLLQQTNSGLSSGLNAAINKSSGEYIARMDADDISHPDRLEKQIDFLNSNPNYVLVGTNATIIDENGSILYNTELPISDSELTAKLSDGSPFYHGSILMRRKNLIDVGMYDLASSGLFEDVLLWRKMSSQGKLSNLKDTLYTYRLVPNSLNNMSYSVQKLRRSILEGSYGNDSITDEELERISSRYRKISIKERNGLYHLHIGKGYLLMNNNKTKARSHLIMALKYIPFSIRAWINFILTFLPQKAIKAWKKLG